MGNYVRIMNWDKQEYIECGRINYYFDEYTRKSIDQCLFDLLITRWKGDRIGAYDEHAIEELEDKGLLVDDWFDKWKDVTSERDMSKRVVARRRRIMLKTIKKEIRDIQFSISKKDGLEKGIQEIKELLIKNKIIRVQKTKTMYKIIPQKGPVIRVSNRIKLFSDDITLKGIAKKLDVEIEDLIQEIKRSYLDMGIYE